MTRFITVTLHKDEANNFSLDIRPLTTIVADEDEEGGKVNVKWLLREPTDNPGYPNAYKMVVTFTESDTPFDSGGGPAIQNYTAYLNEVGVDTSNVLPLAQEIRGPVLHKYNISVYADDGITRLISVDPHIKVRKTPVTKDTL